MKIHLPGLKIFCFTKQAFKNALLLQCAAPAFTALVFLIDGKNFATRDVLFFNSHWYHDTGSTLSLLLMFCVAAGIVGYSKSGMHLAIKISAALFALHFVFCFLDFEPWERVFKSTDYCGGFLMSMVFLELIIPCMVGVVFIYYGLALSLLWIIRRSAMAIRAARELRPGYPDKTNLIFVANTLLIFVGGEDEGGNVALDIRDSVEHLRRFNPKISRWRYFWTAIEVLPVLAFSQMRAPKLRVSSKSH
jgi:hypothetical protein